MEIELLKKYKFWKKGDVILVTNDLAKDLIKKKIAKATGENKVVEAEKEMIEKFSEE
tara:strand:- start:2004 stop:2174 length:171 start_codon:yes stop_codon:yes gene_type:complete